MGSRNGCSMMRSLVFGIALCGLIMPLCSASEPPETTKDNGYVEPFQILDNVYYVGDQWVSAYVISTSQGLILIDTMDFPYSRWLPLNLDKLGLKLENLKYIVVTHGHSEHVSGAGYLQRLTGAKVVMNKDDLSLLKAQSKDKHFRPATINLSPEDGAHITLGEVEMTFFHTPGHTMGCTSNSFNAFDKGRAVKAFVMCGNGTNFEGVDITHDYIESVERIKKMAAEKPLISVNLPTHPHLGQIFERHRLSKTQDSNPFVDHQGFMRFINLLERRGNEKLLVEKSKE